LLDAFPSCRADSGTIVADTRALTPLGLRRGWCGGRAGSRRGSGNPGGSRRRRSRRDSARGRRGSNPASSRASRGGRPTAKVAAVFGVVRAGGVLRPEAKVGMLEEGAGGVRGLRWLGLAEDPGENGERARVEGPAIPACAVLATVHEFPVSGIDGGRRKLGNRGTSVWGRECVSGSPSRAGDDALCVLPRNKEEGVGHGTPKGEADISDIDGSNYLANELVRWGAGQRGEHPAEGDSVRGVAVALERDSIGRVRVRLALLSESGAH